MILVVDNYDSFVYTLVAYLRELGAKVQVCRNDEVPADLAGAAGVLISPGPGAPENAGQCLSVIAECAERRIPMLGVCLGHQALAAAFGAKVSHAPELRHGKTSRIEHDGSSVFAQLPSPLTVTRYHSLAVERETVPAELAVTAWTVGGHHVVMGLRHRELPLHGVQFHPESVMTEHGHELLANWLSECGVAQAHARAAAIAPVRPSEAAAHSEGEARSKAT